MHQIFTKLSGFSLYIFIVLFLVCLIITDLIGDLFETIMSVPLLGYSILLFVLSFVCLCIILYKNKTYVPSILLFIFFLAVPVIGYFSYEVYIDIHGDFHGEQLSFIYPVFVWSVGTAVFFTGLMIAHFIPGLPERRWMNVWDFKRTSFLAWFFLGVSCIAAVIVIVKIGYLPILHSGIDEVRQNYEALVGRFSAKLSRLFIVVSSLVTILFFSNKNKKLYILILLVSTLGLTLYGERLYLFWAVVFFVLIYLKHYKPKARNLLIFACFGICLMGVFLTMAENRAGRLDEDITLKETVVAPLFTEYSYYAFVVNEINQSEQFLQEDIFLGALVRIFPRQIWALFDIDKDFIMEKYSAVKHFGEWFSDEYGTRITPIGEAFAGYGIFSGVCLQFFIFGLLFGVLEKTYLKLNKSDVRLGIICFLLSLFMWLPVASLGAIIDPAVVYGSILLLCQIIGSRKISLKIAHSRSEA